MTHLIALKVQEHYHLKIAGLIGLAASFVIICVALCFVLYLLVICTRKKRATQGKYRSFKFNFVFYCWRSKISIGRTFSPSTQEMVSTRLNNQRPYQGKTSQGGSSQSYRKRNIWHITGFCLLVYCIPMWLFHLQNIMLITQPDLHRRYI